MGLKDWIEDDWEYFDGYETATIRDYEKNTSIRVKGCQFNAVNNQALNNAQYMASEIVTTSVSIPTVNAKNWEFSNSQTIVQDTGEEWTVTNFNLNTLGTRWLVQLTQRA